LAYLSLWLNFFAQAISRVLGIYSLRHPATGYVQGMNDVVIPLLFVFTSEFTSSKSHLNCEGKFLIVCSPVYEDEEKSQALQRLDGLSEDDWIAIEAKCFWSFSRVLESIQDHYTRDQPGIQKKVFYLRQLINQIDSKIAHFW
jgi:hypothetical protein